MADRELAVTPTQEILSPIGETALDASVSAPTTTTVTTAPTPTVDTTIPIAGTVYDPDGNPQEGATVFVVNEDTAAVVEELTTDSAGEFATEVEQGAEYHVATQFEDGEGGQFNAESYHSIT